MKNIFFVFALLFSIQAYSSEINSSSIKMQFNSSDTTVLPQILSLNLSSFIGKPIDSLLIELPVNYSFRSFMTAKFGYAKGVIQAYGLTEDNNCHVEIYVDNFQFQTFPNYQVNTWSMTLAKMEVISYIKIMKNNSNVCVYGCNNSSYYYFN